MIGALVGVAVLAAGIGIGYLIAPQSVAAPVANSLPVLTIPTSTSSPYAFLDPDVANTNLEHFIINFEPLRTQFTNIQGKYSGQSYVYFEYLNNTASIGLNSRSSFTAASTVKVPLAMAIYKMAEEGKLKMTDHYTLEEANLDSNFGTLYNVGPDNLFTIQQLVDIMLKQSDNTAANALLTILQRIGISDPLEDVYGSMGWDYPPDFGTKPTYINIDLHTLSNMFTALYEANYDNASDSQSILSDLAQTPFNDKLAAGLPSEAIIAHKIGIATDTNTYADCGIVYAPERPYMICAAMAGATQAVADNFISQISKAAYQYIISN